MVSPGKRRPAVIAAQAVMAAAGSFRRLQSIRKGFRPSESALRGGYFKPKKAKTLLPQRSK